MRVDGQDGLAAEARVTGREVARSPTGTAGPRPPSHLPARLPIILLSRGCHHPAHIGGVLQTSSPVFCELQYPDILLGHYRYVLDTSIPSSQRPLSIRDDRGRQLPLHYYREELGRVATRLATTAFPHKTETYPIRSQHTKFIQTLYNLLSDTLRDSLLRQEHNKEAPSASRPPCLGLVELQLAGCSGCLERRELADAELRGLRKHRRNVVIVTVSPRETKGKALTPNGESVMFVAAPVHAGSVGGTAANVSPASAQSIGHAVTLIVNGDRPESKTGDGSTPPAGVPAWKVSVDGSIAYCHVSVASNSRSTASGCCAF